MAYPPLSEQKIREAYEAVLKYGSVQGAGDALGVKRTTFQNRWAEAKRWALQQGLPVPEVGTKAQIGIGVPPKMMPRSPRLPQTADEAWAVIDAFIERTRPEIDAPPPYQGGQTRRYVIASDFHAPFHDAQAVADLISREGNRPDTTLVIAGDLLDLYSVSSYSKQERVAIEQEMAGAHALLEQLAAAFNDILLVEGNHDQRLDRRLRALLPEEMVAAIQYLCGGDLSLLRMLAKRYSHVRFAPVTVGRFQVKWVSQIGDVVISHAEKYSRVPGSAMRGVEEWLTDQHLAMGLAPWRVLCQAHTHQLAWIPWRADKVLIEVGCMTETHGYQMSPQVQGRPQRRGWCTLTQVDGVTQMNSIRMHWVDAERWA